MQRSVNSIPDNQNTSSLQPPEAALVVTTDVPDAGALHPASVYDYPTSLKDNNDQCSFFQASRNVTIRGGQFNSTMGHHTSLTVHIGQVPISNTESALTEPAPSTSESRTEACESPSGILRSVNSGQSVTEFATAPHHNPARQIPPAIQKYNEIYEKQLSTKGRGFPLWIPGPNRLLPISYRKEGVCIGDVGILTPFGGFSFLFNVCLPADDPINSGRVPEGFQPISPQLDASMDIFESVEFTQGDYLASASIEGSQGDVSSRDLVFESTASEGAILTVPEGAISFDLENIPHFRSYAESNVESWYHYVNGQRGREAKNGDIRLVTGCDKTTSWGVAVLENVSHERKSCLRFKAVTDPQNPSTCAYTWESSGLVKTRVGPDRQEVNHLRRQERSLDDGSNGRHMNQYLFVRTLNLTLGTEMWENLNQRLSSMSSNGSMQYRRPDDSSRDTFVPDNSSPSASQESSSLARHGAPAFGGNDSQHNITTTTTPEISSYHPSRYLNELLMEKFPTARLIITHDGDWASALQGELPVSSYSKEALLDRVLDKHDIVHEESGVLYLSPKEELTLPSLYPLSFKSPDMHFPDTEEIRRLITFKAPDSRKIHYNSTFYHRKQNESSRDRDRKSFKYLPRDLDSGRLEGSRIDEEDRRGGIAAQSVEDTQLFEESVKTSVLTPAVGVYTSTASFETTTTSWDLVGEDSADEDFADMPLISRFSQTLSNDIDHLSFTAGGSHSDYGNDPSSRSLPDLMADAAVQQNDFTTNKLRRNSFSSISSASQLGPYTPDDSSFGRLQRNFKSHPSPTTLSKHIHSIDMHPIHEFIKDRREVQAAPPDAEELRRILAAKSPHSRSLLQKHAKTSVSTPAGHAASSRRRTNSARFLCSLKDCSASFTRKIGLDNHLKSHLGIMDQKCAFCQRSFSTSLGRHMKRCKQNPNRQEVPSTSTSTLKEGT